MRPLAQYPELEKEKKKKQKQNFPLNMIHTPDLKPPSTKKVMIPSINHKYILQP